jgi:hypothetical protein
MTIKNKLLSRTIIITRATKMLVKQKGMHSTYLTTRTTKCLNFFCGNLNPRLEITTKTALLTSKDA